MNTPPPAEPAQVPEADNLVAIYNTLAGDIRYHSSRLVRVEGRLDELFGVLQELESRLSEAARAPAENTAQRDPADESDTPAASPEANPTGENDTTEEAAEEKLDLHQLVTCVRENVAEVLQRRIPQTGGVPYWCRQWWQHPEAIQRFAAWQESWAEALVTGGNAKVVSLEHLDAMLAVLCGENGPFSGCTGGTHRDKSQVRFLGHEDPPEEYFLEIERIQRHLRPSPSSRAEQDAVADHGPASRGEDIDESVR